MEEGKRVNLTTFGKNKKSQVNHKGKIPAQLVIKKKSQSVSFARRKDT